MENELNKMTAVDWLMEEMSKTYIFNQDDFDMFKKAKEMEKEQIMDASGSGWSDGVLYSNGEIWTYQSPEHYYTETYGGNK